MRFMAKKSKKTNSSVQADPFAAREASKYENPIPSREYILQLLKKVGHPIKFDEIVVQLGLVDQETAKEALFRRLKAMIRDGQILRNRRREFGLIEKMDLIAGKVQGHRDGFGFLQPDAGGEDVFLSAGQMRGVFDGDRALVQVKSIDRKGRREGRLVEVIERGKQVFVGRYFNDSGVSFVSPENRRLSHDIHISKENRNGAKHGQVVEVEIISFPTFRSPAQGKVSRIIGEHMAPGMEIEIAIENHDIPHRWPRAVIREAKAFGKNIPQSALKGRVDLRHLPWVTIDGEDAKDFDDAVYCERKKTGGWRLLVAIADVSHYVEAGSAIDVEAEQRGNSVYFPGHVVPMLPEVLSNGLCSLNPNQDRLCMVCEMSVSAKGKISRYKFYEGAMRSHARLTYTEVGEYLAAQDKAETDFYQRYPHLLEAIDALYALYQSLLAARQQRGALDIDSIETQIIFSEQRKIEKIVPVQRNDAHRLIEECMLAANVASARFLLKHELPALYRNHEGPSDEKLQNLLSFLSPLGLKWSGRQKPEPKDFQLILEKAKSRPDFHLVQTVLLRSMMQAVYEPENHGHFGLNYPAYSHFTSPIRRYSDLLVHRSIRYFIRSRNPSNHVERVPGAKRLSKKDYLPYKLDRMIELGAWVSSTERRADLATRDVMDWLKCEFMLDRVGEEYEGVVSSVTSFGFFVELKDIYVEGLVHVAALESDYYHHDPINHKLTGERLGQQIRLGDCVRVQVANVNLDDRKIEFALLQGGKGGGKKATPAGKKAPNKRAGKRTKSQTRGRKSSQKGSGGSGGNASKWKKYRKKSRE